MEFPELDIESSDVGIFGKAAPMTKVLSDGDRIEIYRPLIYRLARRQVRLEGRPRTLRHAHAALLADRTDQREAFARIGIDAVQLHGGIGYTWEYDAHLFLKRAKWVRPAFGDADWHYERVAQLGGL